jgi:hypothetical protein
MSNELQSQNVTCDPECAPCTSKEAVTDSESWILEEMRAIKETVRPIAERLDSLGGCCGTQCFFSTVARCGNFEKPRSRPSPEKPSMSDS